FFGLQKGMKAPPASYIVASQCGYACSPSSVVELLSGPVVGARFIVVVCPPVVMTLGVTVVRLPSERMEIQALGVAVDAECAPDDPEVEDEPGDKSSVAVLTDEAEPEGESEEPVVDASLPEVAVLGRDAIDAVPVAES